MPFWSRREEAPKRIPTDLKSHVPARAVSTIPSAYESQYVTPC